MHPIIFNAQSVQAILENRKTQTRRVIKPQPPNNYDLFRIIGYWGEFENHQEPLGKWSKKCPYGQPGDSLYVKETWIELIDQDAGHNLIAYKADGDNIKVNYDINSIKWNSSRFMPKWASRITLEITGIRAERLQDINAEDIHNEGISGQDWIGVPIQEYINLWDSLNALSGYPWSANPWVWVIEFKRT